MHLVDYFCETYHDARSPEHKESLPVTHANIWWPL